MSEKKDLASKISSLIALSIIGRQRRKDVSSHVHIIILQKKRPCLNSIDHVDLSTLTMSNLKNGDNEEGLSL